MTDVVIVTEAHAVMLRAMGVGKMVLVDEAQMADGQRRRLARHDNHVLPGHVHLKMPTRPRRRLHRSDDAPHVIAGRVMKASVSLS